MAREPTFRGLEGRSVSKFSGVPRSAAWKKSDEVACEKGIAHLKTHIRRASTAQHSTAPHQHQHPAPRSIPSHTLHTGALYSCTSLIRLSIHSLTYCLPFSSPDLIWHLLASHSRSPYPRPTAHCPLLVPSPRSAVAVARDYWVLSHVFVAFVYPFRVALDSRAWSTHTYLNGNLGTPSSFNCFVRSLCHGLWAVSRLCLSPRLRESLELRDPGVPDTHLRNYTVHTLPHPDGPVANLPFFQPELFLTRRLARSRLDLVLSCRDY